VTFAGAPTTPELVNVSLRHNHLHNIGRDGIQATRFRDVLIEGNEIEGVSKCDPQEHPDVLQTFRDGDGLVFRGNFVHDNAAGILVSGGVVTGLAIENNVIVHQTDQYAAQFYNAPGVRITGNTVWDVRYGVNIESGTTQAVIVNNAFDFLRCTDKSRFQVEDHNLVGGGDFGGPHDRQTSTPGFVDPAKLRYDLAPGSPAIGAGTLDHGVLPTDVDGVPRPTDNPDIGAHQRIASPPGGRLPVAIERGAPYTRDPRVKLELGEAAALGARLEVRNGAGAPTPVPASRAIEWRLPSAPGHATVQQVAVTAFPAGQNGSAQILLDQARPVIRRARLRRSRTNGRPRRLTISARDEGSGLASIQVSARRSPRAPRIAFRRITKVMTAARSWVRVADRAGNLSPWQRVG
jgi:hypothetical protein